MSGSGVSMVGGHRTIARTTEPFTAAAHRVPWQLVIGGYVAAFAAGALMAAFIYGAGWWQGAPWEVAMLRRIEQHISPTLEVLMLTLPLFGTNYALAPVVFAAAAWLARRGYATVALHLVVVQVGSWTINPALKFAFGRERPALFEARGQHAFPAFPSGHSIASVAVLLTVAYLLHRGGYGTWAYWAAGLYILINGYSRLYLGVHWPTDVIGGTVIGAIWLLVTIRAFRHVHPAGTPAGG
jgi:undecaprenyl-diphosphatase